jgi:hypothetical protein
MFVEQLIKKKEENMISGLWRRRGVFSLSWLATPSSFLSFFLYPRKPYSLFYKIVLS